MVTIGMNYDVLPGKEDLFERKFRLVIESFREDAGHVRSSLFHEVGAPGSYLIHSEWESREAFFAFVRSDAFREVTDWGKEQILAQRPRHRVFEENPTAG